MTLENDKIIIERREEIDLMQNMIEEYINNHKSELGSEADRLAEVKNKLDSLWYNW